MNRLGATIASLLLACALTPSAHADDSAHGDAHDDSVEEHRHDHDFELGLSPAIAYLPSESEFAPSAHLHLVAALGDSPWSVGVGFEHLFDTHTAHNTVSAVVGYRVTERWVVALAPGVTFEHEHVDPSLHLETVYELFAGNDLHLGPGLEFAIDEHDVHVSLGVHFGLGF